MKKEQTKGKHGMIEASKKEIAYFESFEGEPVDLNQLIAKSKKNRFQTLSQYPLGKIRAGGNGNEVISLLATLSNVRYLPPLRFGWVCVVLRNRHLQTSEIMKQAGFSLKMKHVGTQLKKFFNDVIQGRVKIDVHSLT